VTRVDELPPLFPGASSSLIHHQGRLLHGCASGVLDRSGRQPPMVSLPPGQRRGLPDLCSHWGVTASTMRRALRIAQPRSRASSVPRSTVGHAEHPGKFVNHCQ
jgi:hypothetical protein